MSQRTNFSVAISLFVVLAFTLSACKQLPAVGDEPRSITLAEGQAEDSVHIEFDVPNLPDKRANLAIMEQLNERLGGLYEGDYADADSMVRFYANQYKEEMKSMREDFEMDLGFERNLTVKRGYETDRLITYDVEYYIYSGGAHGLSLYYGMTFRKSDGRQMGKNVLKGTAYEEWLGLAKRGLMEYFEVDTDEDLKDCLMDVDVETIPMPQTEPCFQEEGLCFTYQQYEIAPYAFGLPSFVIPYADLPELLNITGQRLIEK